MEALKGSGGGTASATPGTVQISRDELVKLCAVDTELYAHTFFPQTFRQQSPSFARAMWDPMEDPTKRLVNVIAFRGSSKTSRARIFASKRIAFGISRTILYIGVSEGKAIESVNWIRNRVDRNHKWRETFGLARGQKWEETQIEIEHKLFGHTIRVLASGVTGSLRGLNIDDYRPDLIIVDDPQNDETAANESQRAKLEELILGAVRNSLTPVSDEPNSKMIMLITPQHEDDISQKALKSSQWTSVVFPCWTQETMDLPTAKQVSSWPERFTTGELRKQKTDYTNDNKLSTFTREMECRLISRETAQFRSNWLNIRAPDTPAPRGYPAVLAIDPVPPPSEKAQERGLQKKDYEAHYVWARKGDEYHLCDFDRSRGHDPSWTVATAFRLARQWRVMRIVIDAVAYQRTLKWILEQEMKKTGVYYQVVPVADGMQKFARITSTIGALASQGRLWIGADHSIFNLQFQSYGPIYGGLDDDLDASALALQELYNPFLQLDAKGEVQYVGAVEDLPDIRVCP
jgi:hypothetical protein